jgi:hypothetical protein
LSETRPFAVVTKGPAPKLALAPLAGGVIVTVAPWKGWLFSSFTWRTTGLANACP